MDAINILSIQQAQQQSRELLELEISLSLLNAALNSKRRDLMIRSVLYSKRCMNGKFTQQIDHNVQLVFQFNGINSINNTINFSCISDKELEYNVQGCLRTINDAYSCLFYYRTHYTYAMQTLSAPQQVFLPQQVLLKEEKGVLRVADLLSVSKYAVKVAQAIDPENESYDKASAAITVFQGIDSVLNNKPEDKPVNKMLHLANDYLTTVVKACAEKKETKGGIIVVSLLVDLAIDFFCKK